MSANPLVGSNVVYGLTAKDQAILGTTRTVLPALVLQVFDTAIECQVIAPGKLPYLVAYALQGGTPQFPTPGTYNTLS